MKQAKWGALLGLVLLCSSALWGQDWVPASANDANARGFPAGNELDGSVVYIIRAPFQGGQTLGKFIPKAKAAYVPWGGRENPVKTFELFVGKGRWQALTLGEPLPPGAVAGGSEADGTALYIVRSAVGKAVVPGKYNAAARKAYIPWDGKEVEVSRFEILVRDPPPAAVPSLEWIPADTSNNASQAVAAGRSPDGTPSFLIRAPFQGDVIPGKYNPKAKSAYVPWGGKENPVKAFELYVGQGRWIPFDAGRPLPPDAVPAGSQSNGDVLLAIRAPSGQALVPGKLNARTKEAYISIGGKEVRVPQFELLVRGGPSAPSAPPPVGIEPEPEPERELESQAEEEPVTTVEQAQVPRDLLEALFSPSALQIKELTVKGGVIAGVGELANQDYQWQRRSVDAYRLNLDTDAVFNVSVSFKTARPDDVRVLLLDPQGDVAADGEAFDSSVIVRGRVEMPGAYTLVFLQASEKRPGTYGFSLQETSFTVEGELQGGLTEQASTVPLVLDPRYPFWTVTVSGDFEVEFDVLDAQGKLVSRSEMTEDGVSAWAQADFTPKVRGPGSVRITPHLPTQSPQWRMTVRLSAGS